MNSNIIAGVDIGGSHITVALVDLSTFEVLPGSSVRERIDSAGEADVIIKEWTEAIRQAYHNYPGQEIILGVAMPGPFDYENGISYIKDTHKYDSLYGLNVKELLAKSLGVSEENIRFNNDAACFLQGEIYKGNLNDAAVAVGMTLGTGMGSAYMKSGAAFDANLWCTPYQGGIIEDYISSRWFVSQFKERAGIVVKDVKEIVEKYPVHATTTELFAEFSSNLAKFLQFFLQNKKGELVMIGGNISKAKDFFFGDVQKKLYELMGYNVPIHFSVLGEKAALIGGAAQFYC